MISHKRFSFIAGYVASTSVITNLKITVLTVFAFTLIYSSISKYPKICSLGTRRDNELDLLGVKSSDLV